MAKSKNTKKNIKKSIDKKIDAMETSVSKELLKVLRVIFAVIVVLGAFYLLTVAILGNGDTKDEVKEATIQYEEILAGSSFDMKEDKYVVCYFDYSDEELEVLKKQYPPKVPIQRYKGLGEMDPEQLWDTTMDPEKRVLLRVAIDEESESELDITFDTLMGEKVEPRREFIEANAKFVKNLDI